MRRRRQKRSGANREAAQGEGGEAALPRKMRRSG